MTKQKEVREAIESALKTMLKAVRNTGSASPRTYAELILNILAQKGLVIKKG